MNPQNNREEELQRRERELQQRETGIRLQELEAEMEPPILPTVKHDRPATASQQTRSLVKAAKFVGMIAGAGILFVIVFRVGMFLANFVIVGIVAWVVYKLFFERDRPNR